MTHLDSYPEHLDSYREHLDDCPEHLDKRPNTWKSSSSVTRPANGEQHFDRSPQHLDSYARHLDSWAMHLDGHADRCRPRSLSPTPHARRSATSATFSERPLISTFPSPQQLVEKCKLGQYERVRKRIAPNSFIALSKPYYSQMKIDNQLSTTNRELTSKWAQPRSTAADPICWPNLHFSTGC
jgi:hypothetical protein